MIYHHYIGKLTKQVFGSDHVQVNCKINWAGLPTVGRASPNFILQFTIGLRFTFSCNSLVHDPGLNSLLSS